MINTTGIKQENGNSEFVFRYSNIKKNIIHLPFTNYLKYLENDLKFWAYKLIFITMITILIFLLIVVSILLMAVVLMQSSKGNGLAGPIGGSSVTMAFGVRRTSDLLTKSTTVLAVILIVGCISVNLMVSNKGTVDESIIQKNSGQQQQLPPQNNVPPTESTPPPSGDQNQQQNQSPAEGEKKSEKPPVNVEPQGP